MIHRIDRHITKLVALELRQSREEYEVYFNSPHEGYALIAEEFCETESEFARVADLLDQIWEDVIDDDVDFEYLYDALKHTKRLVSEAVQTAAMLEKYIESAEEKGW